MNKKTHKIVIVVENLFSLLWSKFTWPQMPRNAKPSIKLLFSMHFTKQAAYEILDYTLHCTLYSIMCIEQRHPCYWTGRGLLISGTRHSSSTFVRYIHCNENLIYVFPDMKLRGLLPNSYIQPNRQTDPGNK